MRRGIMISYAGAGFDGAGAALGAIFRFLYFTDKKKNSRKSVERRLHTHK